MDYETWLKEKIATSKKKRDEWTSRMHPGLKDRAEAIRVWWCYEARARAYEDSLIQYRLMKVSKRTRSRSYDLG